MHGAARAKFHDTFGAIERDFIGLPYSCVLKAEYVRVECDHAVKHRFEFCHCQVIDVVEGDGNVLVLCVMSIVEEFELVGV